MTKMVCDFCGKDMKNSSVMLKPIYQYNFSIVMHGSALDICNECKESFEKWAETRKEVVDEHQDQTSNKQKE